LQNIKTKLQKVYIPFLLVSIGTVLCYTFFRWLFDIKLGILPLKEDLLNIWFPIVLAWIVIFIWLRRRIWILNVRGRNDNGYLGYQFLISITIAAPLILSQVYLVKNSYELHEINITHEIDELKNEKYFKINGFEIDPANALSHLTVRTSGRNNERLDVSLYFVLPFQNSTVAWYGVQYQRTLRNRGSDREKNIQIKRFVIESKKKFKLYNFKEASYFEKLSLSDDRDGYFKAIKKKIYNSKKEEEIILIPKKEAFEDRLKNYLPWAFGSYGIGAIIFLAMVLFPKIDEKELNDFIQNKPSKKVDEDDFLNYLNPFGKHKPTAILLLLNIIPFVIMVFAGINFISPTSLELLEIGGNRSTEVLNGEYWRLFTSLFIHDGMGHLIMTLVGLGFASSFLEDKLSVIRLIVIYIVCGLLASLASIFWYEHIISVGPTGAIFGLYGVMTAFMIFKIYPSHMKNIIWSILGIFGGIILLLGLMTGADNAARFGGLISGFIIGTILSVTSRKELTTRKRLK
jgi:rhomboid protease GluP